MSKIKRIDYDDDINALAGEEENAQSGEPEEPTEQELRVIGEEEYAEDDPEDELEILDLLLDDSVRFYLHEIGQIPLLEGRDAEARLARKIEFCRCLEELQLEKIWTQRGYNAPPDLLRRFAELRSEAERAREQLITANLRLVVIVAKKYAPAAASMSFLDLIQEGNIGLMRAVKRFDWRKECKFSTYATWWIRQAVTRSIADKNRIIRVPVHLQKKIRKLHHYDARLLMELGREPTDEELAACMNCAPEKICELRAFAKHTSYLDVQIESGSKNDYSMANLAYYLSDEKLTPEEQVVNSFPSDEVKAIIKKALTHREYRVIALRHGVADGKHRTLEETGKELGVTRERIRQIEDNAFKKLRRPALARKLLGYIREPII